MRVVADSAVEFAEEGTAVPIVVFPGVFAIEDDGHERISAGDQASRAILPDAAQALARRLRCIHFGVNEADEVAQKMIAEDHAKAAVVLLPAIRAVESFDRNGPAQGAVEDAAIGSRPGEA